MDLSQYSDEELMAIASGQQSDLSSMSDAELEVIAQQKPISYEGQPAAEEDVLGVGASGVQMPTEYGAQQARRFMVQAPSFGFGEELESAVTGQPVEKIRAEMAQYAKERPTAAMTGELVGAIVNPLTVAAPAARPILQAFAGGTLYGAGKAEGDIGNRVKEGLITGAITVPFAYGLQKGLGAVSKALAARAAVADEKMTAESMRTAAKQAYKEADLEGELMKPSDIVDLNTRATQRVVGDIDYEKDTHPLADRALRMIERRQGSSMTFEGLEDVRQRLWKLNNQATRAGDETQANYIRDVIDEIDNTVNQIPLKSEKLKNARHTWKQAQKASALEEAIAKGERRAASTGSGGNVANVYLQAVRGMLENKKTLKFFSPEEIKVMEQFVREGAGKRWQRALSKLAPNGNGLMLALHAFSAAAIDPTTLAAAGAGMAAQAAGERRVRQGAQEIMDLFGGKVTPTGQPVIAPTIPSAYGAEETKKAIR
jgi:hypothetical protein